MTVATRVESPAGLYPRLLGAAWLDVDPAVQRAHRDGVHAGRMTIRYGTGVVARLVCRALRVPGDGESHAAELAIGRVGDDERWWRTVGGRRFVTRQRALPDGCLGERIGLVELRFRLHVIAGALRYEPAGVTVARVPLPRAWAPRVVAYEEPAEHGGSHVRVTVSLPLVGELITYDGIVERGA
jgi:hypothetical protein